MRSVHAGRSIRWRCTANHHHVAARRDMSRRSNASEPHPQFIANRVEPEQPKGSVPKPNGIVFVTRFYRFTTTAARRLAYRFKEQLICRGLRDRQVATAECLQRLRDAVVRVLHTAKHDISRGPGTPHTGRHKSLGGATNARSSSIEIQHARASLRPRNRESMLPRCPAAT